MIHWENSAGQMAIQAAYSPDSVRLAENYYYYFAQTVKMFDIRPTIQSTMHCPMADGVVSTKYH